METTPPPPPSKDTYTHLLLKGCFLLLHLKKHIHKLLLLLLRIRLHSSFSSSQDVASFSEDLDPSSER
jgi:hypothetical protein